MRTKLANLYKMLGILLSSISSFAQSCPSSLRPHGTAACRASLNSPPGRWYRGNGDEVWNVGLDGLAEVGALHQGAVTQPPPSQAGPRKITRCHNKACDVVSEV